MANMQAAVTVLAIGATLASADCARTEPPVLTFSGSVVGREADVIRRQLDRFGQAHPLIKVALRATPDAADQRHQLYVQWLNARATDPGVLQLDVVWTPEFAAAGWIASLDRFRPPVDRFFAAALAAHRWNGALYALPWFYRRRHPVLANGSRVAPPHETSAISRSSRHAPATSDPACGTRAELALLHRRLAATMVYVTHDQEEAMTLGTRIAVGRVELLEPLGPVTLVHLRVDTLPDEFVRVVVPANTRLAVDDRTGFCLRRDRLHLFEDRTGRWLN